MNGAGGRVVRDEGVLGRSTGQAAEGSVTGVQRKAGCWAVGVGGSWGGGRWSQGPLWVAGGRSMFCVKAQFGLRPAVRCGEAFSTREME